MNAYERHMANAQRLFFMGYRFTENVTAYVQGDTRLESGFIRINFKPPQDRIEYAIADIDFAIYDEDVKYCHLHG